MNHCDFIFFALIFTGYNHPGLPTENLIGYEIIGKLKTNLKVQPLEGWQDG